MWKLDYVRSDGTARTAYTGQIQDIVKHVIATKIKEKPESSIYKWYELYDGIMCIQLYIRFIVVV